MTTYPIFLSVVLVMRNQSVHAEEMLLEVISYVASLASDYEIIIVDNGSDDGSLSVLKTLAGEGGLPNLQIYALTKEVNADTASWVGMENALGDFVAIIDPITESVEFLPEMLDKAVSGADVVFAKNQQNSPQSLAYRVSYAAFNIVYKRFNGIDLANEAPQYRLLSKRVINFILQHPQPALTYRHLPASGGFARINLSYCSAPKFSHTKRLGESIDRGIGLLVSTTRMPMRLVTSFSLFGAIANIVYSVYVVAVGFLKSDVAPGWISLSLQQSGMFFLLSLVLLVLGEYILHMVSLSNDGPLYHIGQEFTSARMTRREKLNIEEVEIKSAGVMNSSPERLT